MMKNAMRAVLALALFAAVAISSGCSGGGLSREEIMKEGYKPKNMCENCERRWARHEKSCELKMCMCEKCNDLGTGCEKCRRKLLKQCCECPTCGHLEH